MKKHLLKEYSESQNNFEANTLKKTTDQVWSAFEKSLQDLDPDSAKAFEMYLSGMPQTDIAKIFSINDKELATWIQKIKRQVLSSLKGSVSVRQ